LDDRPGGGHFRDIAEGAELYVVEFVGALLGDNLGEDVEEVIEVEDAELVPGGYEGYKGPGLAGLSVA
jgi:hypothetical protein